VKHDFAVQSALSPNSPCFPRAARSAATSAIAESATVSKTIRTCANSRALSSLSLTGCPLPMNSTARRAAASRRAATYRIGTPAWHSSFPSAWP